MADDKYKNTQEFGRVIYVEPNNNINGTGPGTNFTFEPENYSILVDLQVDVVDRFAYNGSGTKEVIQYTLEWDAKGTKTSMFKGTNGMLTTKALDTTFHEVKENYNQEAIGINSIDIRYNSWNYPEITIQFTDIRGASLLSASDYVHEPVAEDINKAKYADNFANSFFSTFFRFPYPRYTLIVKGFYGNPVSYTLCVNDFKTRFNSQSGNFDVIVSFIGYMYGLLTDIPMRLLFAAPYSEFVGAKYWNMQKNGSHFIYNDTKTQMLTFLELYEAIQMLPDKLKKIPEVVDIIEKNRKLEERKNAILEIKGYYEAFRNQFDNATNPNNAYFEFTGTTTGEESAEGRVYLFLFSTCSAATYCEHCNKDGKGKVYQDKKHPELDGKYVVQENPTMGGSVSAGGVTMPLPTYKVCEHCKGEGVIKRTGVTFNEVVESNVEQRKLLWKKIKEYNESGVAEERTILTFPGIESEGMCDVPLKGASFYNGGNPTPKEAIATDSSFFTFGQVESADYESIKDFIANRGRGIANQIDKDGSVAVCVINVDKFLKRIKDLLSQADLEIEASNEAIKRKQEESCTKLLGFKVSLKNVMDMALAHLDTFMQCMYTCMDMIRDLKRDFSDAGLSPKDSDVFANADTVRNKSKVYLPPFFAFRKVNPKNGEYEDEWLENDPRFVDRNRYIEIQLIDGLLNAALHGQDTAKTNAEILLGNNSVSEFGEEPKDTKCMPTFANDFVTRGNPYENVKTDFESVIAMFAYRCMLASIYSIDYPNIGSRFDDSKNSNKRKYFEVFGENDANNFALSSAFETFKNNFSETIDSVQWDDFKKYITGQVDSTIMQRQKGHMYFAGVDSPLFTNYKGNNYIISYGNSTKKEYVVPMNYKSPSEALNITKNVLNSSSGIEPNAFGITRLRAMPSIDVIGNDTQLCNDREVIRERFEKLGGYDKAGWYFKTKDTWKEYFSGVMNWEVSKWFPSMVLKEDFVEVNDADVKDGKNRKGNLYLNAATEGKTVVAFEPLHSLTGIRDFFFKTQDGDGLFAGWFRKSRSKNSGQTGLNDKDAATDDYIEKNVVPAIVGEDGGIKEDVTVYGLACGDGTLFGSEFYAIQEENSGNWKTIADIFPDEFYSEADIINFRKAFLFLHSLPTSEYGSLGGALSTIIKRTYTPSITDIPLATTLFIGALLWRDKANGGKGNVEDKFINYDGGEVVYKKAKSRQLITYSELPGSFMNSVRKIFNITDIVRRPLNPIKVTETNVVYLTVIDEDTEKALTEFEKNTTNGRFDARLRRYLDGESSENNYGYKPFYWGFWDLDSKIKDKFIKLFSDWVRNYFVQNIDSKLSIKKKDGTRFTPKDIKAYRDVVSKEAFNNGVAKKNNVNGIPCGTTYNDYLNNTFSSDVWTYYTKLGASKEDNSLQLMFRKGKEPVEAINRILTNGSTVSVPFPRVLMTRDMFNSDTWDEERYALRIDEETLKSGWEKFKKTIKEKIEKKEEDTTSEEQIIDTAPPASITPEVKLSLYETLKNIHDKWLVATDRKKYIYSAQEKRGKNVKKDHHCIADSFFYINSFYEDVGEEIMLNVEEMPKQLEKIINSINDACSLYSFMYDIAAQARTQLLALPVFNDMSDPAYVRKMFTPIPYDELDFSEVNTETQYVFLYPEEASKQLDLMNDSRLENERYKYQDDSFMFVEESGLPATPDEKIPKTFYNTEEKQVPVFGVTFAKQNQSFFKSVNVSMDNPKTTEVAIHNTFHIAEKYSGGNTQIVELGQDLFPIYSNYSYECSVEMMGCACIMPLMYFQLNNIPMFKGTFIIYNVSHKITPGNMITSFSGQRLSRFRKKRNESAVAATPNDEAYRTRMGNGSSGPYGNCSEYCYTKSKHKLEHELEYNEMLNICGVDKNILRAVEIACVNFTGGFFADGKPKMYYDPWQAKIYAGVTDASLIVDNQFDPTPLSVKYDENVAKIAAAIASLGGGSDVSAKVSACTINGAFSIPGQVYSLCGAASITEFLNNMRDFGTQGKYFATLLNNKPELKTALQNKDWNTFAKLYVGTNGLTESGIYCPRDSSTYEKFAEGLRISYDDVSNAERICYSDGTPSQYDSNYVYSPGQDMHLTGSEFNPHATESKAYADAHPLDVRKATETLRKNAGLVLAFYGNCKKINTSGRKDFGPNKGDIYYSSTYGLLTETAEHKAQPGTKPPGFSLGMCATYVKCALADGGYPYFSCDGGACGPLFEKQGFEEIYRSKSGDPWSGSEFDAKWQTGDVLTIDSFTGHKWGHVAMWDGEKWISDFAQKTCITYNSKAAKDNWNSGGYHFWRYRNIVNK